MNLLVDTSVWSLAFRRDNPPSISEVDELHRALTSGDSVYVTGLILQELLQGFAKPKATHQIIEYFKVLPLIVPDRDDHIEAAEIRNGCRRNGIQIGTIDALLAQLCIRHQLLLLTTDQDFKNMSRVVPISLWN